MHVKRFEKFGKIAEGNFAFAFYWLAHVTKHKWGFRRTDGAASMNELGPCHVVGSTVSQGLPSIYPILVTSDYCYRYCDSS